MAPTNFIRCSCVQHPLPYGWKGSVTVYEDDKKLYTHYTETISTTRQDAVADACRMALDQLATNGVKDFKREDLTSGKTRFSFSL